MNRASQALALVFAKHRGAQSELAVKTGISQSWLSRLADGALPNRAQSLMLQKETGIDPAWWDEPVKAPRGAKVG